ncbi:unnamed protein product [Withania somnifera]
MLNQPRMQVTNWPWKHIWRTRIPFKVACFSWLLAKEAVLTQENLIKRKWILCCRCFCFKNEVETVGHLFLHCSITDQLWKIIINLRGIAWTMPRNITEALFRSFLLAYGGERNSKCFENSSNTVQKIKFNFILLLCFWCNQVYSDDTISTLDTLGSC